MLRKQLGVNRRSFLKLLGGSSGALVLGISLPSMASDAPAAEQPSVDVNAFIRLNADGSVDLYCKHLEMGQGAFTAIGTLIAEELDFPLARVRLSQSPSNPALYNNTFWGQVQGTGGSTGLSNSYLQMRVAGAAMRKMLLQAAAQSWGVAIGELTTEQGVINGAGRTAPYAEFADAASKLAVPSPKEVTLKSPDSFRYIGRKVARLDTGKLDGSATFTQDIQMDGMLTAVMLHPPRFGAKVASVDKSVAEQISGANSVFAIESGVAVIASDFWTAQKVRKKLKVNWDESTAETISSDSLMAEFSQMAKKPGLVAETAGSVDKAWPKAAKTIELEYRFPYLAHAPMEPMNCVAKVVNGGCEIWTGAQIPTLDMMAVSKALGIAPEKVVIHTYIAGGSFGRRACPGSDYIVEAARIAANKPGVPIKMVWTREEDTQGGWYRPPYLHRAKAAIDDNGKMVAWQQHIVGPSIISGTAFEGAMMKDGVDHTTVEGALELDYQVPNRQIEMTTRQTQIPIQWWRSVGHTHTAYVKETLVDQLAKAAGQDPVEFRLAHVKNPRYANVLKRAANKFGWDQSRGSDVGVGIAVHYSFFSYVAIAAEVKRDGKGIKVTRVVCSVDCGIAVNPDVVAAQMEGGLGYGLSMALFSKLTVNNGAVKESNFHNYKVARMRDMPEVEVDIVTSTEAPTGVGEPATAVIAPAVANAIASLTGQYATELPIKV